MLPAWLGWSAVARFSGAPVRLILDTDMGGGACRDVDDFTVLAGTATVTAKAYVGVEYVVTPDTNVTIEVT